MLMVIPYRPDAAIQEERLKGQPESAPHRATKECAAHGEQDDPRTSLGDALRCCTARADADPQIHIAFHADRPPTRPPVPILFVTQIVKKICRPSQTLFSLPNAL